MEQNIYSLCRHVGIRAENFLQKELSDLGLTPAQANLLLVILRDYPQGTTITQLHRRMGITKSSLSALIKSLKQKEYLRVESCEKDDRVKLLLPTEKLRRDKEKLQQAEERLQSAVRKAVGESKLFETSETLRELCRMGEEANAQGVDVK